MIRKRIALLAATIIATAATAAALAPAASAYSACKSAPGYFECQIGMKTYGCITNADGTPFICGETRPCGCTGSQTAPRDPAELFIEPVRDDETMAAIEEAFKASTSERSP